MGCCVRRIRLAYGVGRPLCRTAMARCCAVDARAGWAHPRPVDVRGALTFRPWCPPKARRSHKQLLLHRARRQGTSEP